MSRWKRHYEEFYWQKGSDTKIGDRNKAFPPNFYEQNLSRHPFTLFRDIVCWFSDQACTNSLLMMNKTPPQTGKQNATEWKSEIFTLTTAIWKNNSGSFRVKTEG